MAIAINWNAFRKGYREGEVEDQADERFALDQETARFRLGEEQARAQFESQMRPFRLQSAQDQQAVSAFNLRGLGRADDVATTSQPGALALAGAQGTYRTELAQRLDFPALAQNNADRAMLGGQLALGQTQQAIGQLPTQRALFDSGAQTALAQGQLQRGQIGVEQGLLPMRAATAELGELNTQLDQQYRTGVMRQNINLLGEQGELRRANLQNAITQAAQGAQSLGQRQELVDLLGILTDPDQIRIQAESFGMTPEVFLDQLGERATQMGVVLNTMAGGAVDSSSFTPRTRADATATAAMLAGRMSQPRAAPTPRAAGGARTAAAGGAAGATATNPIIGATPGQTSPASLFPSPDKVKSDQAVKKAVEAVGPAPKLPSNIAPNDVKAFNSSVDWGSFSDDRLQEINRAGGLSAIQTIAVQGELHRRAVARAKQGAQ